MKGMIGKIAAKLRNMFRPVAHKTQQAVQKAKHDVAKTTAEASAQNAKINKALWRHHGPGVPNYTRIIAKKRVADHDRKQAGRWTNSPVKLVTPTRYHTTADAMRAMKRLIRWRKGMPDVLTKVAPRWMRANAELAAKQVQS